MSSSRAGSPAVKPFSGPNQIAAVLRILQAAEDGAEAGVDEAIIALAMGVQPNSPVNSPVALKVASGLADFKGSLVVKPLAMKLPAAAPAGGGAASASNTTPKP